MEIFLDQIKRLIIIYFYNNLYKFLFMRKQKKYFEKKEFENCFLRFESIQLLNLKVRMINEG